MVQRRCNGDALRGRDIVTIDGTVGKLKQGVELIRRAIAEELGG